MKKMSKNLISKVAVIVVGAHYAGKTKTINQFFKPMVELSGRRKKFTLKGIKGLVFSQSLEERRKKNVEKFVKRYAKRKYIVCPARPPEQEKSLYGSLKTELESNGFKVYRVDVTCTTDAKGKRINSYYKEKAENILDFLNKST